MSNYSSNGGNFNERLFIKQRNHDTENIIVAWNFFRQLIAADTLLVR